MDIDLNGAAVDLEKCARLQVRDGVGRRVLCLAGSLWITQENDTRDIFLQAGESFVLDRRGLAIIGARAAAKLMVLESGGDSAFVDSGVLTAPSCAAGSGRVVALRGCK